MIKATYLSNLKRILQFGGLFMLGEAVYHFSGIRMLGTNQVWPNDAIEFGRFFMFLWASASFLLSGYLYLLQKNIEKFSPLITWTGYFALFHSSLLWWCATRNYEHIWPLSTLYFWNPYYSYQLVAEGLILFLSGVYIIYGQRKKYL